ncbi:MAG: hypothetical protein EOM05_07205, partial [Clostridia bacterium]|nr:hypothetical protein [Clostridia bacterium]
MKKQNLLYVLIAFVILACGSGKEKSDDSTKSYEPNNKIEEASELKLGTEIKMSIDKKEDVDWYKVEISEQGYLRAVSNGIPENLDVEIRFAKYDEWGEDKEVFLSNFEPMPSAIQVVEPGTYYAYVADRWGENFSKEEFSFKLEFLKEFDEYETNNEPLEATVIDLNKEYNAAIFPKIDHDWFKVTTEEQGYLEIKVKDVDPALAFYAIVAKFDEYADKPIQELKYMDKFPDAVAVTESGEYYIKLCERWGENSSEKLFNFVVNFIPEMDTFEPNNEYSDAKEITGNETIEMTIFPTGDADLFLLPSAKKAILNIKGKGFGNVEPYAILYVLDDDY